MDIKQKWTVAQIKVREKLNPYLAPVRRKMAGIDRGLGLTIISNNCWGGHVYRYFGLSYTSPTIGMFFFADEYLRFLKHLDYYLLLDLKFIPLEQSRYYEELKRRNHLMCPIGVLDDVEIVFLHYHSKEEAREKWNRRKLRMDMGNLIVKMSEMNLCTESHLREFDALPFDRKFVFVHKDYGLHTQIVWKEYADKEEVSNDTDHFRRHINLIALVKGNNKYKR
jgi:uncharacterized protein (DUF1919 family)